MDETLDLPLDETLDVPLDVGPERGGDDGAHMPTLLRPAELSVILL